MQGLYARSHRHLPVDEVPTLLENADSRAAPDLLRLLKRYRLRQKVDIDDVSQQYRVWALYGGEAPALQAARSSLPPGWDPDPRSGIDCHDG